MIPSVLVALLAMVLAGKGMVALREAGWPSASPIASPRIEMLGLFSSVETLVVQGIVLSIVLAGF